MPTLEQWLAILGALGSLVVSGLALAFWLGGQRRWIANQEASDARQEQRFEEFQREERAANETRWMAHEKFHAEFREEYVRDRMADKDSQKDMRHDLANGPLLQLQKAIQRCEDDIKDILKHAAGIKP